MARPPGDNCMTNKLFRLATDVINADDRYNVALEHRMETAGKLHEQMIVERKYYIVIKGKLLRLRDGGVIIDDVVLFPGE